jgi:hypothetical protein
MLQHNTRSTAARRTHWVHALVVGVHVLCCGLPAGMALLGVVVGALAWAAPITALHRFLHGYEPEIIALSFSLVAIGGLLEWRRRAERKGFPTLYALSLACFVANAAIVAAHRLEPGAQSLSEAPFAASAGRF